MNIDFELVMYDFVAAFREAEGNEQLVQKGVQTLRQLVFDKMTCQARMFFLQALDPQSPPDQADQQEHWQRCIKTIAQFDFEKALSMGKVTLQDLVDLTCHPEALWQLHCALCTVDDDRSADARPG